MTKLDPGVSRANAPRQSSRRPERGRAFVSNMAWQGEKFPKLHTKCCVLMLACHQDSNVWVRKVMTRHEPSKGWRIFLAVPAVPLSRHRLWHRSPRPHPHRLPTKWTRQWAEPTTGVISTIIEKKLQRLSHPNYKKFLWFCIISICISMT